ncbi:phosphoribosylglycinamide formyltransferase [Chryseosolibacter indicus]|uniref:Phosphoribosylglycinamide formyltransferase n=1 Tax=Chryseosolibacter indicus TaxID=2782351 RepID=A0ABS5VNT3_9BACT|nr:phosphoribosylglycinamide formyltransferase [Chryseosolibacter indicus]MBT1703011.1 phosphoribosylglycinamide formyltransferase [Chryseosolibacter indicus]
MKKSRIAILASGNGTNAEEIIKYFRNHASIEVILVLSNNVNAFVLERAKKHGITHRAFTKAEFKDSVVLEWLKQYDVTHIVLAGFLWLIPDNLIKHFPNKIINIHPALLPKHGGKGMYGMRVHEAVKISGDVETGITIHLVNEHYDEGKILFQARCSVETNYTPQAIAECVHKLEYEYYPKVIEKWIME